MFFVYYLLVLAVLILLFFIFQLHFLKVFPFLIYKIEEIMFFLTEYIYLQRKDILRYEEAVDVLFFNKKKFIEWKNQYSIKNINLFFENLTKDVDSLWKMLDKKLLDKNEKNQINKYINFVNKISFVYRFLYFLIGILTLWIFFLFVKIK